ncbi:MAG: hypothetical protein E7435_02375 [Ruminococcaceae bacterium]|nr:hypothetical protein [Oscillospiraceae bacterium]
MLLETIMGAPTWLIFIFLGIAAITLQVVLNWKSEDIIFRLIPVIVNFLLVIVFFILFTTLSTTEETFKIWFTVLISSLVTLGGIAIGWGMWALAVAIKDNTPNNPAGY